MEFQITSKYKPTGDQPEAINSLVRAINSGDKYQTLLGVTGSGKTFTVANVINQVNKPTLILSHNKTLAAQLYSEFKTFFPNNAVEYFVSYYDYYQPEAYLPVTDTYIEKDLAINDELEKLRLSATSALLSGRKDIIVVSSVSCIYGIGNPEDFHNGIINIEKGQRMSRNHFLRSLTSAQYKRNDIEFKRGNFRVKGDTVDLFLAYVDEAYRVIFWGEEIDKIEVINPISGKRTNELDIATIFPANIFITNQDKTHQALTEIQLDLGIQVALLKESGKTVEAKRLEERVNYDIEMIKELGYCSGIENYSRYFDGRSPGSRPFCLLDFFPKDFLMVIDESHVTISQIKAMYGGDYSRKINLVEHGFRLPAAIDNRPLKFDEFETIQNQVIYVSATPADYELEKCEGVIVEQVIRPTGLLDPIIEVRPSLNQIDDLLVEIQSRIELKERTLVTTLTKRMAEELAKYLKKMNVKCEYIHSDVDTLDRVEILSNLRKGTFDVLIGVNLLREGLDLPEVSLVAILDADKEGFLRSTRALIQTSGRAARNVNGKVIMYADIITKSMQETIDSTNRRREKQIKYNIEHNITPTQIKKDLNTHLISKVEPGTYIETDIMDDIAADPVEKYMSQSELTKLIARTKSEMQKAAKELDFMTAAQLRNEMFKLEELLKTK
ncbi:MAG: excinuclease ABC subunit UvrB [Breznakibacter sp.]|nr:excinuclease ABC subunit UvrB [Breznakibacter sp.]